MSDKIVELRSAAPSRSVNGTLCDPSTKHSYKHQHLNELHAWQMWVVPVLGPSHFSKLSAMLMFNHGLSFPLEQPRLLNIIQ